MRFVKPDFIYGCEKIPLSVNTTLNSIVVVNAIDTATNIARYIYDIYQRYIYMIYIYDIYMIYTIYIYDIYDICQRILPQPYFRLDIVIVLGNEFE